MIDLALRQVFGSRGKIKLSDAIDEYRVCITKNLVRNDGLIIRGTPIYEYESQINVLTWVFHPNRAKANPVDLLLYSCSTMIEINDFLTLLICKQLNIDAGILKIYQK